MPANGTALIKRPLPGHELACGAHEADFDVSGAAGSRGVVSYYATSTMVEAATFESWLDLIERKSSGDLAQGRITELHKPTLQIYGNPNTKLPGCRVDLLATALDK